jgi:hypothetical protein
MGADVQLQGTVSFMELLKAGRRTDKGAFLQFFVLSYPTKKTEGFYLLGHDVVSFVEIQQTFHRNMSPPFSGSKNKLSKKTSMKQMESTAR